MVLGLGSWEVVLVGLALLVFFGPEHAPQALRTLGRWQTRIRHTLSEIEETLDEETQGLTDEIREVERLAPPPEAETWSLADPADRHASASSSTDDPEADRSTGSEEADASDEDADADRG